jgi:glycerate-2-kinase
VTDSQLLLEVYRAALAAVDAREATRRALLAERGPAAPVVVLAAGKAACAMARAACEVLAERIRGGAVYTREGHAREVGCGLRVREAGHPLPDARSVAAAGEALRIAASVRPPARLLVLLSGGASAVWCAPAEGLTLRDKLETTDALLRAGADIAALNTVRKQLSRLKGGRLARVAEGCEILTLAISDVRGDLPDQIGSGPTVPDPTSARDALAVLEQHGLVSLVPAAVRARLERAAASGRYGARAPGPGAAREFRIVASLDRALEAAAGRGAALGLRVVAAGASAYGDVADVARELARLARQVAAAGDALLVCGGEPTVRVRGPGRGGRCQELAVRLALELDEELEFSALCAGTDGSDGPTDAAGALVDGATLRRAAARGVDARAALERSDSYALLDAAGALLRTGPTQTNVADLMLVRVRAGRGSARAAHDEPDPG